jgi:TRAP-type C4-dicarboxylate transport system substrate-binding protein
MRVRTDVRGDVEGDTVDVRRGAVVAAVALVGAAALCLGCQGPAVDKQGALPRDAVTLSLGAADPGEPSLAHFVEALHQATGGRIRVDVDRTTYYSETRGGPGRLAPALTSGEVDLALIPSRDWAATGDPGFVALQAPFLVASTAATTTLARSDVAKGLLKGMAASGAVGLGLVPGEPRRLLTRQPVVDEAGLSGLRIRVSDSTQSMALLAALGADPVQGMTAADVRTSLRAGTLAGVEMAPVYLGQNGYNLLAPYLSSFALIPKFEVLAASWHAWRGLSPRDREAVSSAAARTVEWEAQRLADDEAAELSLLCGNGLVVVAPSASSLRAWRERAASVEGAAAEAVRRIRSTVTPDGSADQASALPASCPLATAVAQARALHEAAQAPASSSSGPSHGAVIPPGTYRETVTAEQFVAARLNGPDFAHDVVYTWVFRADGTFEETQEPDYPDQGRQSGRYTVHGDQLTMTYAPGSDGVALPPERAQWSFYEGTLSFSHVEVQDAGATPLYEQPWHKVG